MGIFSELKSYLQEFNFDFEIDTIRIDFLKSSKKSKLDSIGRWNKIKPNHQLFLKLQRRYEAKEIQNISNSFEYLKIPTPKSPVQHVISFTLAYYMNLFSNKVKY